MVTGKYIKVGWGMSRVRVVVCCVGESNTYIKFTMKTEKFRFFYILVVRISIHLTYVYHME